MSGRCRCIALQCSGGELRAHRFQRSSSRGRSLGSCGGARGGGLCACSCQLPCRLRRSSRLGYCERAQLLSVVCAQRIHLRASRSHLSSGISPCLNHNACVRHVLNAQLWA